MAGQRTYTDFDLIVEPSEEGAYRARVVDSPAGEASGTFTIPFSDLELDNFLLRVGRPRRGTRRLESPEMEAARDFGSRLFEAVFHDELQVSLRLSLEQAERRDEGLRIRLRLADAPELASLPWEYLFNEVTDDFFVLSAWTPVIRYIDLTQHIEPLAVEGPLRVLVMISSPTDYPELNVETEWHRVEEALAPLAERGAVVIDRADAATLSELSRRLLEHDYHIFHYLGHGGFDERADDGVLVLEDENNRARLVPGRDLGTILRDHRSLRLTVLNACEGARASEEDPFSGTAQSLVRKGIPGVVAMQFEITDDAAIAFAQGFYTAVAKGLPVDAAIGESRRAIFAMGNDIEWGTPVLYLRGDGRLFDVDPALAAAAAAAATPLEAVDETVDETPAVDDRGTPEPGQATPVAAPPVVEPPAEVEADDERGGRVPVWAWVVAAVVVLLGAIAIIAALVDGDTTVATPSVEGETLDAAVARLVESGLTVGDVTFAPSDEVAQGDVVEQDPVPGIDVGAGSAVDLVISLGSVGPATAVVPDLVGLTESDAGAEIEASGFVVGIISEVNSDTVPEGMIVSQSPEGGMEAEEGTAVELAVSKGPVPVTENPTVPAVVGLGLDDARAAIEGADLGVGVVSERTSNTASAGIVVEQSPPAGEELQAGTPVDLVISSGPAPVAVPDVIGLTLDEATARITERGLALGEVGSREVASEQAGQVVDQAPVPGGQVPPGTVVDLTIGRRPGILFPPEFPVITGVIVVPFGTTITFSTLPDGSPVSTPYFLSADTYASKGIVTRGAPEGSYCDDGTATVIRAPAYSVPVNFLTTATPGEATRCNSVPIEIEFDTPVRSVTLTFYGAAVPYELTAFNGVSELDTVAVTGSLGSASTIEYTSDTATISRVRFGHTSAVTAITEIRAQP